MTEYTSIQVSKETRDKLRTLALTANESYESILQRIIESKLDSKEIEYLLNNADEDCYLKAVVDWSLPDCIKFFDKDGNKSDCIPNYDFDDKDFQVKWDAFAKEVNELTNIIKILAVLEMRGESIRAGDLILSRL